MKTNSDTTVSELKDRRREMVSLRSLAYVVAIVASFLLAGTVARGQVHSGSTGVDGAFNPTTNPVVAMSDHPTGIYPLSVRQPPQPRALLIQSNTNRPPVIGQGCFIWNG